ncbi:hypothetical protein ACJX4K_002405 [Enterococcus faecalis]|nr:MULTISPECIES: hypothetical protein [Enterococcus]OYN49087.1 hypothetical protein B7L51_22240 [Pectobacterium carotovorum]MCO5391873.1 hypothetical protein [Enterococcus faecalis]MCO5457387.1 hypothetical protein [Enterococcus faecalis]MCO5513830.1 hypothetical protein [Enterococcus faecalis]MCO5519335.1 hypothetical protein [Enterococcus faecalis]
MEPAKQFSYGKQIYDLSDEPELNPNQQIVLDWLKANVEKDNASPMCAVFLLGEWQTRIGSKELRSVDISYCSLNPKQQAQVLEAFSQWTLEQEEAE